MSRRLHGTDKPKLYQLWTSRRFRMFLKEAAALVGVKQSEFVREAVWERITAVLPDRLQKQIDAAHRDLARKERAK